MVRRQSVGRRHHERTDEREEIPAYLTTEGRRGEGAGEGPVSPRKYLLGVAVKSVRTVDKGREEGYGISGTARDIGGSTEVKSVEGTDHHGDRISKVQREQQRRWKDVLLAQRIETGSERVWLVAKRRSIRQV